jgi:hypothetical protein
MLEDKIKAFKITKIEGNLQALLNTCVENLLHNILLNAKYVLEITNRKIVKVGHLRTINYIQKKSIGLLSKTQTGGFAVLPAQYFGNADASYGIASAATQQFGNLGADIARNGLESTFTAGDYLIGGGGANRHYYMDNTLYEEILDKIKTKLGIKISSDALEFIRLSVELNIDMLIKETLKTFKLKTSISVKNVKSVLKNKKYLHFTNTNTNTNTK